MLFHINASSGVPVYTQIVEQLKRAITSGVLQPGDRLPAVRELAERYGINPNTVARAYRQMVEDHLLSARAGGGTFVGDGKPDLEKRAFVERLRVLARQIAVEGQQMRLPREKIVRVVEDELDKLGGER